jgi:hypothetical protein
MTLVNTATPSQQAALVLRIKPSGETLARPSLNQSAFEPFVCSFGQRSAL